MKVLDLNLISLLCIAEPLSPKGGEIIMRNYELVFVVKPNADEEAREAILNKVKVACFYKVKKG